MKKNKFMLGKLFGSSSRVKILKLFILHSNNKYYLRQVARDLGLQLNSVRRELENLEEFGLLTSDPNLLGQTENADINIEKEDKLKESITKIDKKYYKVNTNFVLFEEVKALLVKSQILYEKDFVEKMKKIGHVKLLILAGFFVGDDKSMIDLFLVGKVNKHRLLRIIKELEEELGKEINYTLMEPREFKYRRDITDIFLYSILENKKIVTIDEYGIS
jgi:hypothetical protein